MNHDNLLVIEEVSYKPESSSLLSFGKRDFILSNISLQIKKGEVTGIAGQSGSGKTTLAKLIAGILTPSSGKITLNTGTERTSIKTSPVQILFQNNGEVINPLRKIYDIVSETAFYRNGKKAPDDVVAKIFEYVNFEKHLWHKKGFQLSGGEQQRAALARTIAAKPALLILDEPFSAQDPESQQNLIRIFNKINKEYGITIICISHNLKILKNLCSRIIVMYKGKIAEQDSTEKIFSSPSHSYTKFLLKAENYDLKYDELNYVLED